MRPLVALALGAVLATLALSGTATASHEPLECAPSFEHPLVGGPFGGQCPPVEPPVKPAEPHPWCPEFDPGDHGLSWGDCPEGNS